MAVLHDATTTEMSAIAANRPRPEFNTPSIESRSVTHDAPSPSMRLYNHNFVAKSLMAKIAVKRR
ncbi:hypothetical protein [Sphingomonas sp. So64.6b]|uniref:hypothetical protein n=1 Tax=Sphingomonas sp. So64.6b TaxID=2997354 RepID=UPI001FCECD8A|nr:hypothetical protein [Sphingomonas sp. So64.6b]